MEADARHLLGVCISVLSAWYCGLLGDTRWPSTSVFTPQGFLKRLPCLWPLASMSYPGSTGETVSPGSPPCSYLRLKRPVITLWTRHRTSQGISKVQPCHWPPQPVLVGTPPVGPWLLIHWWASVFVTVPAVWGLFHYQPLKGAFGWGWCAQWGTHLYIRRTSPWSRDAGLHHSLRLCVEVMLPYYTKRP